MAKNKKDLDLADSSNLNQIKKSTNVVFNILFVILALTCIIPVVFIFIISITSEQSIKMNGYQFIPESYSLDAYKFLFREGEMILRALGVSVLVTAVGTTLGVILTMLMGYKLRSNYKLNEFHNGCIHPDDFQRWYDLILRCKYTAFKFEEQYLVTYFTALRFFI